MIKEFESNYILNGFKLNSLIERNLILQQSIGRRTAKYRQYLMDAVKNQFRFGEFKLSLKIHGVKKKKRTEVFEVVKGYKF
jgi:hypothetical protein